MEGGGLMAPALLADHDLVQRLRDGDREAGGVLYERYHARLLRLARRYANGQDWVAEDLVHDAFIKFLEAVRTGKYQEQRQLAQYLLQLTANVGLDHVRKASTQRETAQGLGQPGDTLAVVAEYHGPHQEDEPLARVLAQEQRVTAHRLLEALPGKEAAAAALAGADFTMQESARHLVTTVPAIKARLWRARAILERLIAYDPRFDALRPERVELRRFGPDALPKAFRTLTEGAAES